MVFFHARIDGIRNQQPSVLVPVTCHGEPQVLTPGLFMINKLLLLKVISFLETDFIRNFCKFNDSISTGYVGL
jgi:hypothetical protein